MSIFSVTNTNDSGPGSLRQTILDANALTGADSIIFDPTVFSAENTTISFSSDELITDDLSINGDVDGDGDADVTLDGLLTSRIFTIAPRNLDQSISVSLNGLDFVNGAEPNSFAFAADVAGAILSESTNLSISNASFSNNVSFVSGGALFLDGGSTLIENSVFSGNSSPEISSFENVLQIVATSPVSVNLIGTPATFGPSSTPYITSSAGGAGSLVTITVVEDTVVIADFETVDSESSEGNGLTYSFFVGGSALVNDEDVLNLDPTTGVLSFTRGSDFENPSDDDGDNVYQVRVGVTDADGNTDFQDVSIIVTDVDEEAPRIFGGATAFERMPENAPVEAVIADFNASDDISAEGSGLTYSITGGADGSLFTIEAATGILRFANAVDFENPADADRDNVYSVQVTVTDATGKTDVQDFDAIVTNVEEPPVITSNGGEATAAVFLEEGTTTRVTDVQSNDDASAEGSGISYSITGGDDRLQFTIDTATGVLSFVTTPDFEDPFDNDNDNVYDVQVTATDAAGLTDVQDIAVTVTDVDDIGPSFGFNTGFGAGTISTPENQAFVIDLTATDNVSSEGNGLTYQLSGSDAALFTLDPVTGVLAFLEAPDFEVPGSIDGSNTYALRVDASDAVGNSATQLLEVTVTNADEAPVITSDGGGTTAAISLSENTTLVTDLQTTDDISAEGSGLTYSITGGDDRLLFTIDAATGVLSFADAPDFETPADANVDNVYDVQITATDAAGLTDVQDIAVTVADVDDQAPVIFNEAKFLINGFVELPSAENDTAVFDFNSTDNVSSEGSDLEYSIFSTFANNDLDLFEIEASTGVLRFLAPPDFEAPVDFDQNNQYLISVAVKDAAGNEATENISVVVTDVDETPPPTPGPSDFLTFSLVDTGTDQVITSLTNGEVIDPQLVAGRNVSIVAEHIDDANPVGSVELTLGSQTRLENVEPYALFGDDTQSDFFDGTILSAGPQQLDVRVFSEDVGAGTELEAFGLQFSVGSRAPGEALQISDFFEFALVDTDADAIITPILDGSMVDATLLEDRNVSVIATQFAGSDPVASVTLTLGGQSLTENVEPYALFGDDGNGDFLEGTTLETGSKNLGIKAYSEDNAQGTILEDLVLQFTIVDDFTMA